MMHKCIMVKIGGSKKHKLSKKRKFCGNRVKYINLTEIRVKFLNFVEIGEYAICIIGLGGWTSLVLTL